MFGPRFRMLWKHRAHWEHPQLHLLLSSLWRTAVAGTITDDGGGVVLERGNAHQFKVTYARNIRNLPREIDKSQKGK